MANEARTSLRDQRSTGRRRPGHGEREVGEPAVGDPGSRRESLTAGGTDGNERLTVITGVVLLVLLAVLGVTILRIGQLLWLHLFLGLLLIGPVVLKLLSTGYRFMRYYTSDPPYRRKGPPEPLLRLLAPLVVLTTLTVFASGVALLLIGPSSRGPLLLVHKASFILWVAVAAVHVLGHLPEIGRLFRLAPNSQREMNELRSGSGRPAPPRSDSGHRARTSPGGPPGRSGRALSLVAALAGGLVLAVALIPQFAVWTDVVFRHH